MSIIIGVTTTPRPGVEYLSETIRQLDAAGADGVPAEDKIIYSDGVTGKAFDGWTHMGSSTAQGSRRAFWALLRVAYDRKADILGFEDDLLVCKNAVTKMLAYEVPDDLGFISFFDNVTPANAEPGLHRFPLPPLGEGGRDFWGVQAVKIPFRSLRYLLFPHMECLAPPRDGRYHSRDLVMQHNLSQSPTPRYGVLFPHLVQHIGDVSVVQSGRAKKMAAEGKKRISHNFPGEDFDALSM